VFVEGASNIIINPEFGDIIKIRELLRVFEEKERLIKILSECVDQIVQQQAVAIRIGAENTLPTLRGCAVITSNYSYGDQIIGSLGIVGPVRMEYARAIGAVNLIARLLEQALVQAPAGTLN
jgi:heat-inducible transcriptional repressor